MLDLVARPLLFAALAALAFAPLEALFAARPRRRRRFTTDLAFATVGQVLTALGTLLLVGALLSLLEGVAFRFWGDAELLGPAWLHLALGLFVFELGGYAYHRLAHGVPLLWRFHAVHHSSEEMDWLAAFRQHPLEIIAMTAFQNAPLVLLGIPLAGHAAIVALLRLHTVLLHCNLRVAAGPWDLWIAMPRFHQRHHQRDGEPKNFASLFPWLDVLAGSHCRQDARDFGVAQPLPRSFLGLLLHPLRIRRA